MAINLAALKTELQTDPNGYGYSAFFATDLSKVADLLNLARATIQMPRPDVTPAEILEAINVLDFIAAGNQSILMGSWLESLTQFAQIRVLKADGSDTRIMSNLMRVLANGSASETRIRALSVRNGSRAEQLFGVGTTVSWEDVAHALGS